MNTNQLKRFAQEARRKLLGQVGAKLSFVLTTDSAELREKTEQLKQLREELGRTTKEQLIEKVAYTWFNRLMALRFMDANDYQPLGIRIITPKDGYTIPELLDEAKRGNIPEELRVNQQKIYDLLDNKMPSTNPQNEAYKELLIATCNHLHTTFPFLFEKINDYTELLLPDDLTSDFSILKDMRDGMLIEDCKNVEIIGWLYQFYISEKKDVVIGSKTNIKKEDIPAATQLFTPRWIVEYMVQNTLGKLWLQNRPKSKLREYMPYFIESVTHEAEDFLKINSPEEIKLLDPACGSGHILVYAFDLFTKIYEEEGYNTNEISKLITEKNLFGFEIDERAAQLSGFALMMKAREFHRSVFSKEIRLNILCYKDLHLSSKEIEEAIKPLDIRISDTLLYDLTQMQQATNFGSLITPHSDMKEIQEIHIALKQQIPNTDVFQRDKFNTIIESLSQLELLSLKFHCVIANPPYMGGGKMNTELSNYVGLNYPDAKADLITCFVERGITLVPEFGYNGFVTMESWMFLSRFEMFRNKLLSMVTIQSLSHFGWHIMRIAFGTVSFIYKKSKPNNNSVGIYSYMDYDNIDKESERPIIFPIKNNGRYNHVNQDEFKKIPASRIGYWVSKTTLNAFANNSSIDSIIETREGLATADNDRFLRFWWELNFNDINFTATQDNYKLYGNWFPYVKGGAFRKWYGNYEYVVNWGEDGFLIRNNIDKKTGRIRSHNYNGEYAFREGVTWSGISALAFSMRIVPDGFMFDAKGPMGFSRGKLNNLYPVIAFLNSKCAALFLKILAPTLDFKLGHILSLPFIINNINISPCIQISKDEWDSRETSWGYLKNELIRIKVQEIEETFDLYQQYWKNKFLHLHKTEEELNRQIIALYQLQDELTPEVSLDEITILKEEITTKNGELKFQSDEVFAQFISYAVGCMLGRYSLNKEGLILANKGESFDDYLQKVIKSEKVCSFLPDADNIIPILDNEWFEDDIVNKFYLFLKITFGEKDYNKNLAFIEEQMGKNIRRYFTKEFYPDHIKRYNKRPIYWMFSSPQGSFNVLIYMHRYTTDTVGNILNKYLKEFIGKLNTQKEHLQNVQITGSASDKTKAIKELDNIDKILVELHDYERDVLYPLATERIEIDLDDGVLVNYNKFGKAVKEVNGLNDPATKKKVKQFVWIDTSQIR